jgi:hypothetical protein
LHLLQDLKMDYCFVCLLMAREERSGQKNSCNLRREKCWHDKRSKERLLVEEWLVSTTTGARCDKRGAVDTPAPGQLSYYSGIIITKYQTCCTEYPENDHVQSHTSS